MRSTFVLIFCLIHSNVIVSSSQAGKEVGSSPEDVISVSFLVIDLRTGAESTLDYKMNIQTLRDFKLTAKQIRSSWIEIEKDGEYVIVTPDGRRIPTSSETKRVVNTEITRIEISADQNINLTMKDIINDPELIPVKVPPIEWPHLKIHHLKSITFNPNSKLIINDETVNFLQDDYSAEGLFLVAINPLTCYVTLKKFFYTNNFGVSRDLGSVVNSLLPGRIIVIFSQSEGSFLLLPTARKVLSEAGSAYVNHYLYGDSWVWVFVKDGPTIGEALIPNLGSKEEFTPQPSFEVNVTTLVMEATEKMQECPNWPNNEIWNARRAFCQINDGIKSFCNCDSPFQFVRRSRGVKKANRRFIPILIICGARLQSLLSLLESLSVQKSLTKSAITLVLDGDSQTIRQFAYVLGLRVIVHRPVGYLSIRVSRNLRFGLFNALKIFPKSQEFIILEDDLLVSPDFYSYMTQLSPVFDIDPSIYAVSGFNFLSSPKASHDPSLTYRIEGHPAYGWMMSRSIIEELLPKWPHKAYFHDWDHLFATDMFRKGRQCVIPDVNRIYHNCVQANGIHVKPTWYGERQFLRKGLNNLTDVILLPNNRLQKPKYEKEMRQLVKSATIIDVKDPYNITLPESKTSGVYVIFVKMDNESDYEAFRLIGDSMETWIGSPSFHMYNHTWRLFYNEHPLLVVGVPFSYYTRYMPNLAPTFSVSEGATKGLLSDEKEKDKIPIVTHRNLYTKDWKLISLKEKLDNFNLYSLDNFSELQNLSFPYT